MRKSKLIKEEKGQAVAEMAFVLPVLLLMIMAIITLGMMIYVKTLVVISASQAAKVGAYLYYDDTMTDDEKDAKIRSTANTLLSNGINGTDRSVTITSDGIDLTVTVEYNYKMILPLLGDVFKGKTNVPLKYSCTYMIQ